MLQNFIVSSPFWTRFSKTLKLNNERKFVAFESEVKKNSNANLNFILKHKKLAKSLVVLKKKLFVGILIYKK